MLVEVVIYAGRGAESKGVVKAKSHDEAVQKVFANKLLYPRVDKEGDRWRVRVKAGFREVQMYAYARKPSAEALKRYHAAEAA